MAALDNVLRRRKVSDNEWRRRITSSDTGRRAGAGWWQGAIFGKIRISHTPYPGLITVHSVFPALVSSSQEIFEMPE